ncbi:hypothetical protein AB0D87_26605 [Streptomyces sp. NPDC048342]|uniref:hypothetical protein n=1 Tax=Streptomyces sp. NPDC048342 TaxID=3154716 RepID=UPI0034228360
MTEESAQGSARNGPENTSPAQEGEVPSPVSAGPADTPELGVEDIRRALSARAAQPGSTDERLDAERDARSYLSRFAQSRITGERVYGGDHIEVLLGQGRRSVRAYQLSAQDIDLVSSAFLPPASYGALLRDSEPFRVVLLSGAQGHGKYAVAQRLLLERGHATLQCLEPDADLTRLEEASLRPGHGYLLQELSPGGTAAPLTGFELHRLNSVMRARDCRLVITLRDGARTADPELGKQTFPVSGPPAPWDVFERHLRWWLGPQRTRRAEELLRAPETAALFTEPQSVGTSLARAAENARLLSESSAAPADAVRQVREHGSLRDAQEFEKWFNSLDDLPTQCVAVATAVFGGEAYETVSALATSLGRRLQPPPTAEHPERPRNEAVTATRATRLRRLNASLVGAQVASRHGGAPAKVVRFDDSRMASRVLQNVWEEYDVLRHQLPGWLKDCASHELATVRTRAAVAVGFLAELSFDSLRTGVLQPWARSPARALREAAATALVIAAESPELASPVRDLIHAWAGGDAVLRATAARAWTALGRSDAGNAGEAVALLDTLAATDSAEIIEAICLGVTESLAAPDGYEARDALHLLRHWISRRDAQRRTVGELSFLFAAADLLEDMLARGGEPHRRWPKLLALATRDPVRQRDIALLWDAVLQSPETYAAATQVLTEWARMVDPDPSGRRALARLLHAAAPTDRSRRFLLRHVSTWSAPDSRAARSAGQILSHFDSKGSTP